MYWYLRNVSALGFWVSVEDLYVFKSSAFDWAIEIDCLWFVSHSLVHMNKNQEPLIQGI